MLEKKVVILDFDMRKPKLDKVFNLENKKGISTILIGQNTVDECIFNTGMKDLDIIPCGPIPPNPAELIHSKKTNDLIAILKESYDVIIIDTAPVGLVADALGLFKMVNVPVYMMRSGFSKREFVKNVNRLIEDNGIKKMSLILNDVDMEEGGYGSYGGGYGYGYIEKEEEKKWYRKLFNR